MQSCCVAAMCFIMSRLAKKKKKAVVDMHAVLYVWRHPYHGERRDKSVWGSCVRRVCFEAKLYIRT